MLLGWSLLVFMVFLYTFPRQDINRYSISPSLAPARDVLMAQRLNWNHLLPTSVTSDPSLVPFSILSRQLRIINVEILQYNGMNRMIKHNLFSLYLTEADAVIRVGGHLICLLMLSINQCFPVQLSHYILSFSIYSHPDIRTITIKRLIISSFLCLSSASRTLYVSLISKVFEEMQIAK